MSESKRLLAQFVDGRLSGEEMKAVRERMENDPAFARRVGMYQEDDLLLRDAIASLSLTDGLAERICADLPERPERMQPVSIGPGMAATIFLAAGLFTAGSVLFQGTARMLGLMGIGSVVQTITHVAGVLGGFALLVWSGRQAMRLHSALPLGLADLARRPGLKLAVCAAGVAAFLAVAAYAMIPGVTLQSWDAVRDSGMTYLALAVALGIPLLIGMVFKAGELVANDGAATREGGLHAAGNAIGMLLLAGACTAHYLFVAV